MLTQMQTVKTFGEILSRTRLQYKPESMIYPTLIISVILFVHIISPRHNSSQNSLWHYMLEVAYLRLQKEEDDTQQQKDLPIGITRPSNPSNAETPLGNSQVANIPLRTRLRSCEAWTINGEIHPNSLFLLFGCLLCIQCFGPTANCSSAC